jgi:hypothetical protein
MPHPPVGGMDLVAHRRRPGDRRDGAGSAGIFGAADDRALASVGHVQRLVPRGVTSQDDPPK